MTMILLADSEPAARALIARAGAPPRLLVLADGDAAQAARAAALALGADELPRGELVVACRDAFRRDYLALMASVNEANHAPFWWAMPFTTKNPLSTALCRQVFDTLLVARAAAADSRALLVVADDADLAAQIRAWARATGHTVRGRVRARGAWWRRAARRALPAVLALTALPIARRWWEARGLRARVGRDRRTVVVSLVHAHSFGSDGAYRDAYFGTLPAWLATQGERGVLMALLIERPGERLLPRLLRSGIAWPVLPVEGALSLGELLRCFAHALARWARPFIVRGDTTIAGVDVRLLVARAAHAACRDGALLDHLRLYYAGRALAHRTGATRWLYPFENRAFEKMLLTGVREAEPAARLVGYNHASITLAHTNFVLEGGEPKITPLPDTILTLGTVVHDWLESHAHFPPGTLRVACALRQQLPAAAPAPRRPVRDVLLALATSVTEYVRTLRVLEQALRGTPYRLRVRPHPTIALETGLRRAALPRTDFFTVDAEPLAASLAAADVVLYASSTVGLEAVARGIPAVYLDIEDVLETDPMLGWSGFRWAARGAGEVRAALRAIEALDDAEYARRRDDGIAWARRYLVPATEEGMRRFLAA